MLVAGQHQVGGVAVREIVGADRLDVDLLHRIEGRRKRHLVAGIKRIGVAAEKGDDAALLRADDVEAGEHHPHAERSEEHPSELQSLMRISYAVFGLEKKIT